MPVLDMRSLGLFRVVLGTALLLDLLVFRIPNISAFYSSQGILGPTFQGPTTIGLLNIASSWTIVTIFFVATFVAYTLFLIGYKARFSAMASLWCLWSIHERSPIIVATDDQAMICLLLWSVFLPVGDRFSVGVDRPRAGTTSVDALASFAILVQVAAIYTLNALPKTGFTWRDGLAISYALQEDLWAKASATWLAQFPVVCRLLTYSVRPIEYSIPLLIFLPFANHLSRIAASAIVLWFHWSIFAFIGLGFFPVITSSWAVPYSSIVVLGSAAVAAVRGRWRSCPPRGQRGTATIQPPRRSGAHGYVSGDRDVAMRAAD